MMLVIKQRKKLGPGELVQINSSAIDKIRTKKHYGKRPLYDHYLIKDNILVNGVTYSVVIKTRLRGSSVANYSYLIKSKSDLILIENSLLTTTSLKFDMIYQRYSQDARSFLFNKYSIKVL